MQREKRARPDESAHVNNGTGLIAQIYAKTYSLQEFLCQFLGLSNVTSSHDDADYLHILTTTVIGINDSSNEKLALWTASYPVESTLPRKTRIEDVLDRAINSLSYSSKTRWPSNVLAYGFSTDNIEGTTASNRKVQEYTSSHFLALREKPWQTLLDRIGESAMLYVLINTSVFLATGDNYFCQAAGQPIHHLIGNLKRPQKRLKLERAPVDKTNEKRHLENLNTIPVHIHTMLYKSANNVNGRVKFGLPEYDFVAKYSDPNNSADTKRILMSIFRKQYSIKNVFDMAVNKPASLNQRLPAPFVESNMTQLKNLLPKSLKGGAFNLVKKIQGLHNKCPYYYLLEYYCPAQPVPTSEEDLSFLGQATRYCQVCAYVKAVLRRVLPAETFGSDANRSNVYKKVEALVCLRRYEKLTLHYLMQGIMLSDIQWLGKADYSSRRMPLGEFNLRSMVLTEFIFWLFDSLVLSIIRGSFYVTDSRELKNTLVYFRHDVWLKMTRPYLDRTMQRMFEEIPREQVKKIALKESRVLGFATTRLLPKETGARLITKLTRNSIYSNLLANEYVPKHNQDKYKPNKFTASINECMRPVLDAFYYEMAVNKNSMGATVFSSSAAMLKILEFQSMLKSKGLLGSKLYFVKVDIQSCFDSIPPKQAYRAANRFLKLKEYGIRNYNTVFLRNGKPMQVFTRTASPAQIKVDGSCADRSEFASLLESSGKKLQRKVFVDNVRTTFYQRKEFLNLLGEHTNSHIVKVGRKYYKQKLGIPQGSVVSTFLCNILYARLESDKLSFALDKNDSLLVRLTDDFLYVTTSRDKAIQFFRTMADGHAKKDYGATIHPEKSLVNFDLHINGLNVPRLTGSNEFPYCGYTINTTTLEVKRDLFKSAFQAVTNIITVEYCKEPTKAFTFKIVNLVSILFAQIYGNSELNSHPTILTNIYRTFVDLAMRCACYAQSLSRHHVSVTAAHLKDVIDGLISAMLCMTKSYRSNVSRHEIDAKPLLYSVLFGIPQEADKFQVVRGMAEIKATGAK